MINSITQYIYTVTGHHNVVGNVGEFVLAPEFASARIRPGKHIADVESSFYGLLIAVLTGLKAPKCVVPHALVPGSSQSLSLCCN